MSRLALFLALSSGLCHADVRNSVNATCRVTKSFRGGGSCGTGSIFRETQDAYHILTNAHVAGRKGSIVYCQFWFDGWPGVHDGKTKIAGRVILSTLIDGRSTDVAVVSCFKKHFPLKMPVIPVAPPSYQPPGLSIVTTGCQACQTPRTKFGYISGTGNADTVRYRPPSIGGDSGSTLTDLSGRYCLGLVAWKSNGEGLAMHSGKLRRVLAGETTADEDPILPKHFVRSDTPLPLDARRMPFRTQGQEGVNFEQVQCPPGSPWCPLQPNEEPIPFVPYEAPAREPAKPHPDIMAQFSELAKQADDHAEALASKLASDKEDSAKHIDAVIRSTRQDFSEQIEKTTAATQRALNGSLDKLEKREANYHLGVRKIFEEIEQTNYFGFVIVLLGLSAIAALDVTMSRGQKARIKEASRRIEAIRHRQEFGTPSDKERKGGF